MNRPPIIVILGHVDHGKTTLLDYLRHTSVAAREAGGITQSIRPFQLLTKDYGPMTFIDTPGHAAFDRMRKRGSQIADLAVLVVAADDGVQPQTRQSIEFIKASHLPFIVALNKSDLSAADPDRVKTQLTEENVIVEDFGGEVPCLPVSAKTGKNLPELLEMINLVASLNPPQVDSGGQLDLMVLESRLDSRKGPLATVVVKNGTLRVGQELFQDSSLGRVKALTDSDGLQIKLAGPSAPAEILGLNRIIDVGSAVSDRPVNQIVKSGSQLLAATSDSLPNLIVKADVAGSLEAVLGGIRDKVNVISSGTGDIIENDILLAHTSGAGILGFNLKISGSIAKLAQTEKVRVKTFSIIYELYEYVDELLLPKTMETVVGQAQVLAEFKNNAERVAGCKCTAGQLDKSARVKITRGEKLIGESRIKSLRLGKSPVDHIKLGSEFGLVLSPSVDFKVGDAIIATIG